MATENFTPNNKSTPNELAMQFPCNTEPFAVWYSMDEKNGNRCWAINDETGGAVYETPDLPPKNRLPRVT